MTPTQTAPPLRVWAYTALIIVCLLIILANEDRLPAFQRSLDSSRFKGMNVQRLNDASGGALQIVALGSSKTLYALDYDQAFADRLPLRARPVIFHRLTWLSAKPSDMEPALRTLSRRPPAVLLLEADLLLLDRPARFPIRDNLRRIGAVFSSRDANGEHIDQNVAENRGRDDFPSHEECASRQSPEMRLLYASHVETWKITTLKEQALYLRWLRVLRDRGTQVVLLRIPGAPWAHAVLPSRLTAAYETLLERLVRDEGFSRWESGPLSDAAFCDEGHMTAAGRALYSSWLASRLSDFLSHHDE
jgi:hypothetical protein